MLSVNPSAGNFLHKGDRTSLVVVKVDSRGNPDSVSYWKNPGRVATQHHENNYAAGALVDVWV